MSLRRAWCVLVLCGCAASTHEPGSVPALEPLLGSADGQDAADRACRVVLRTALRAHEEDGRPSSVTIDGLTWLAFEASFDVAEAALAAGGVPALLHRDPSSGSWYEVAAEPVGGAPAGFARFRARFAEHTLRDGISTTSLTRARIELVPLLHTPGGGRLFDHNVHPGDLDNYALLGAEGFALSTPTDVCPGASADAVLSFDADYGHQVHGSLRAGGTFAVDYALARLPQCHGDVYMARRTWDTIAFVRALPSGELAQASVVGCDDERCLAPESARATFRVPEGTNAVELWFMTSGRSCGVHYDSAYGQNYRFGMVRSVGWVGDFAAKISREGGDPCEGASPITESAGYGTWARMRAITSHVCFRVWSEGVTDRDAVPAGAVQASLVCRWDGDDVERRYGVGFDARVGNDARYRLDLRGLDPFRAYTCPDVPTRVENGYLTASATCAAEVNGATWGPSGEGGTFRLVFSDYPESSWRDANCE